MINVTIKHHKNNLIRHGQSKHDGVKYSCSSHEKSKHMGVNIPVISVAMKHHKKVIYPDIQNQNMK